MARLLSRINCTARAGHVFHLDFFGVEFGRCGCHPGEGLTKLKKRGILWPEPDWIHPLDA